MNDADELNKLADLHARGVLSDDEFAKAKSRVLGGHGGAQGSNEFTAVNSLRRARTDRWLGGVCGGIARATGLESWIWRLIFVALLLAFGGSFLLYILLWIFVPEE